MMPLAFDLISTLVIGSTLPVATTERTMVPRSTAATFEGSMGVDAPLSVEYPQAPASSTTAAPTMMLSVFDVFIKTLDRFRRPTALLTNGALQKLPRTTLCGF